MGRIAQEVISDIDYFDSVGFLRTSDLLVRDLGLLGFGLLLVSAAPRRSGVGLPTTENWRKAAVACLVVVLVSALYRYFPFDDSATDRLLRFRSRLASGCWGTSFWLVSPLAQELVFSGFIFGLLQPHFSRPVSSRFPITGAVVITALLFGLWHLIPDFFFYGRESSYSAFRFAYTAAGMTVYGMTRIWTGTIAYAVVTHSIVNFMFLGGLECFVSGTRIG